jgi:CspA family cold shock protein
MLKTITKFVLQRRRQVPERREEVIEADSADPSSHSEVSTQLAEPQLDAPSAPTVWGKVKWYNPAKRYGFVELSDGSGDAFLHATALGGTSIGALRPGVSQASKRWGL